ncbi:hypothetical protein ACQ86N_25415 [Puia sp. P3]|uniref:hypothetical protein n=1 Tax=Puia sp. P3 TaxID=3423952 RepID=UPI003D669ED2
MKVNHEIHQQLIQKVQEEFSRIYPFLRIEFAKTSRRPATIIDSLTLDTDEHTRDSAKTLLEKDIGLSDQLHGHRPGISAHQDLRNLRPGLPEKR